MVLFLDRILTFFTATPRRPAIPRLDLATLSDHALKDLNLPHEFRAAAEARRGEATRLLRW